MTTDTTDEPTPAAEFTEWRNPTTGERRRYITNVAEIVFPVARANAGGSLSNNECRTIRSMIMQGEPYATDDGRVRGGSIITEARHLDVPDFKAAVKAAVARAMEADQ